MAGSEPTLINSVRRALRILEAVAEAPDPPSAARLSAATGLARATTYHLLRTLVAEGYLVRTPERAYALGDRLGAVSERGRVGARTAALQTVLADLRDRVGHPAYLMLFREGAVEVAAVSETHRARAVEQWIPFDDVPHATALGKATLGAMPPSVRHEFLARHGLRRLTGNTITRVDRLIEDATARPDGCTLDREEYLPGVACLAAPVVGVDLVGAVGISFGPRVLGRLGELPAHLRGTAERVSRLLLAG